MPIMIIKDGTVGKVTPAEERRIAEREKRTRKSHLIYTVTKGGEPLGYGSTEEDIEIKNGISGRVGLFRDKERKETSGVDRVSR